MVSWTRSHLIDSRFTALRRNLVQVNPSFELTNTATYTNLATNPSFETTSGYTTLRTNSLPSPDVSTGIYSWNPGTATHAATTGGRLFTATAAGSQVMYSANIAITPGTPVTAQVQVGVPVGQPALTFRLLVRDGAAFSASADSVVNPGTQKILTYSGNAPAFSPPGTTIRLDIVVDSAAVGNQWVVYDLMTVEQGLEARQMFSGSSTYPDSDITTAWTSSANYSPSIARGETPTNTAGGISSTQWSRHGTRSVRRTGGTTGNDSYAIVASTTGGGSIGALLQAGKTYTVVAWLRQTQALTGTPASNGSRLISYSAVGANLGTGVKSVPHTNAAGVYEHRITFTVLTNDYAQVRLYNGTSWGNGDVWWDDLVIVEGVYTGGYFDGTIHDDPDLSVSWTGAANASTSIAQDPSAETALWTNLVQNPAGLATGNPWTANSGVGDVTQGPALGTFATSVRMTRIATGALRVAGVAVPMAASTPYTLRFVVRASEAMTFQVMLRPTVGVTTGQVQLGTVSLTGPETKEFVMRGTSSSTTPTDTSGIAFVLGATDGGVGATLDIVATLVQGSDGPGFVFSGSSAPVANPPLRFAWNGQVGSSSSTAYGTMVLGQAPGGPVQRTRTNLYAKDPSFALGTSQLAVSTGGSATLTQELTGGVVGPTFARATVTAVGFNGFDTGNTAATVVAGPMSMSVYVRSSRAVSMRLTPIHAAGSGSSGTGATVLLTPGVWTRLSWSGTLVASGALGARLRVFDSVDSFVPGDTLDVDGFLFEATSGVGPYFDGSTSSTATVINAWTGTAAASTSTQQILLNYVTNGVVAYRSSQWHYLLGAYSMQLVATGTSNDTYVSWGAPHWIPWGLTRGRRYMIRASRHLELPLTGVLHPNAGKLQVLVSVDGQTWDPARTVSWPQPVTNISLINEYVTLDLLSDVTGIAVVLNHGASQGNGDTWWDGLLVQDITDVPGPELTTNYFDGSYPWAAWTGAPHLSTSVGYRWALP